MYDHRIRDARGILKEPSEDLPERLYFTQAVLQSTEYDGTIDFEVFMHQMHCGTRSSEATFLSARIPIPGGAG